MNYEKKKRQRDDGKKLSTTTATKQNENFEREKTYTI